MIYGLFQTIENDAGLLTRWVRQNVSKGPKVNEDSQKIQDAALRMLAVTAMVFSGLWCLKILTFMVTVPLGILFKLSIAVSLYALSHDIFIMIQNHAQEVEKGITQGIYEGAMAYLRGVKAQQEEQARQFTHGTYLQPIWMHLYVNRSLIALAPATQPQSRLAAAGQAIGNVAEAVVENMVGEKEE